MSAGQTDIDVRVAARRRLAAGIVEFTLARPDGAPLPPYGAGAHIDVETPGEHRRSYSLCEPSDPAPDAYVIAVDRQDDGEGGSTSMHRDATPGTALRVSSPTTAFTRQSSTRRSLLIAGGIGITAVRGLMHDLRAHRRPFTLLYLVRERARAAYLDELARTADASELIVHVTSENDGRRFDLWPLLKEPATTELYCCGPAAMMREVKALTMHWRPSRLHFEDFQGISSVDPFGTAFTAVWGATGQEIAVDASASLLDRLTEAGIGIPSSCRSGTCGTCRVRVLSGTPHHRDVVLRDDERETQMISCVSRAEGRVVLDRV